MINTKPIAAREDKTKIRKNIENIRKMLFTRLKTRAIFDYRNTNMLKGGIKYEQDRTY